MKILSIDPGLERTGYAVFNEKKELVEYDCIITSRKLLHEDRISDIYNKLNIIIQKHKPDLMVIERIFFTNNQKTVVSVAQAQGVLLLLASENKIKVEFLSPTTVKSNVCGSGTADKKSVCKMVKLLLNMQDMPKLDDTTDAIAIGLAYNGNNL